MKILTPKKISIFILTLYSYAVYAQTAWIDSLKKVLSTQKEDTNKVNTLNDLGFSYAWSSADTGLAYAQEALTLAEKLNFEEGILEAEFGLSGSLITLGNFPLALDYGFKALSVAKKINNPLSIVIANANLGLCYYYLGEYNTSLRYVRENLKLAEQFYSDQPYFVWMDMARGFEGMNQHDSAILYAKKGYEGIKGLQSLWLWSYIYPILGNAFAGKANYDSALFYYRTGIPLSIKGHTEIDLIDNYNGIAGVYKAKGNLDSAAWYAKKTLNEKTGKFYPIGLLKAANMLADIYESQNKSDSTLKYLRRAINLKDSLFNREKTMAIQNLAFKEQEKQKENEASKLKYQNQLRMYSLLGGLVALLLIIGILLRNSRHKQKANALLNQKNEEIQNTLTELKSTQAQLIQSEKMASLGELTAGIAHEIQNPLNFVNNFSEVNKEMIAEMKEEIDKGNYEEVKLIANDIEENEEKINHHGKRADSIVKGMLQHSKQTAGIKELTDINALCDEYLRLSYHGLRAKDKSFNAVPMEMGIKTDFDQSIGKINIVPQDIGRVLLNLFNNAFYAVYKRRKAEGEGFKATVSVQTKKLNDKIEIRVVDNGNGIPQNIIDKIFQPFFTTKPTGQGTGLGLSLAYDIIKAHGGEIKVETNEGAGSEFIIQLTGG